MEISIKLIKKDNEIIANCPELDINCYGENREEAIKRIKSVIKFYIDSAQNLGLEVQNFKTVKIEGKVKENLHQHLNYNYSETIN